jgi:hypothetical protein
MSINEQLRKDGITTQQLIQVLASYPLTSNVRINRNTILIRQTPESNLETLKDYPTIE